MANITDQRDDRRGERKDAAHHQVLDRVGVDVDAIDRVARARRDVVVQAERLQVLEQPVAQVVHHPLAGIDLHLRAVRGHELVDDLQHDAGDDDDDEQQRDQLLPRASPASQRVDTAPGAE